MAMIMRNWRSVKTSALFQNEIKVRYRNRSCFSTHLNQDAKIVLNDGNKLPVIGLGTWKSKPNEVKDAIKYAIKIGYRHIDCAPVYQNEREVGEALKEVIDSGLVTREHLFVTTKLWNTFHRPELVRSCLEQSLHDLRLKYVDCFLMHWPVAFKPAGHDVFYPTRADGKFDVENVPLWETWEAMEALLEDGLTNSIGVSNFSIEQLSELVQDSETPPAVNQIELHPYLTQKELVAYCRKNGIAITAYSSLGHGKTQESYAKNEPILLEDPKVLQLSSKYHKTPAQILLHWAIQRGYSIIPKSSSPQRIKENYHIFDMVIADNDMKSLDDLNKNTRYVKPEWSAKAK